jgi:hypothetical protein
MSLESRRHAAGTRLGMSCMCGSANHVARGGEAWAGVDTS